jgi:hypothetical protein
MSDNIKRINSFYFEWNFYTSQEIVARLSGRSVESFFDELPQAATVFDLVDLLEFVGNVFFRIEIPVFRYKKIFDYSLKKREKKQKTYLKITSVLMPVINGDSLIIMSPLKHVLLIGLPLQFKKYRKMYQFILCSIVTK